MNMKNIILSFLCVAGVLASCSEENIRHSYGEDDGMVPGKVEVISNEKIPGGVIIHYKSPNDADLMYVKACYKLASGKDVEVRVSSYDNKVTLEGFNDEEEKNVYFYCVDRHENVGEPVEYSFVPGVSPLKKAYETINIGVAFGGANITLENEDKGNLVVEVLSLDSLGQWYPVKTEYTSSSTIKCSVRGFDSKERLFGVCLHDRWDNFSDTVFQTLTPMEEYELDKSKFKEMKLDNDVEIGWGLVIKNMWDGRTAGENTCMHTIDFNSFPQWFTFDLGVTTKLSRYLYWQRQPGYWYLGGNIKRWEIWGRADAPSQDGSWDGWILLSECECKKPSGLPPGQNTQEDIDYATNGEEFEFDPNLPAVRYIRFKGLESFDNSTRIHIEEVTFFGQKK